MGLSCNEFSFNVIFYVALQCKETKRKEAVIAPDVPFLWRRALEWQSECELTLPDKQKGTFHQWKSSWPKMRPIVEGTVVAVYSSMHTIIMM